jgi:ABC-type ATPase involved in cell division
VVIATHNETLVAGFDHPVVRLEHGTLGFVAGQRRRAG